MRMDNRLGLGSYTLVDIFAYGSPESMNWFSNVYDGMERANHYITKTLGNPPYGENYIGYKTRVQGLQKIAMKDIDCDIYRRLCV
jgi:hypothetical protein